MIQQSPTTEGQIISRPTPDNRDSFHHWPTFQRRNRIHFKDSGVAVEPVCPRFFTRVCPALFPPPHFGTLSKIQKGGEPVPRPGEAIMPSSLSVQMKRTLLPCLHVCCAASCACVRAYLCHLRKTRCTVATLCPFVLSEIGVTLNNLKNDNNNNIIKILRKALKSYSLV